MLVAEYFAGLADELDCLVATLAWLPEHTRHHAETRSITSGLTSLRRKCERMTEATAPILGEEDEVHVSELVLRPANSERRHMVYRIAMHPYGEAYVRFRGEFAVRIGQRARHEIKRAVQNARAEIEARDRDAATDPCDRAR